MSASADALARYISLRENRSAKEAVEHFTSAIGKKADLPLLFLHGPPGCGKSHLVDAVIDRLITEGQTGQTVSAVDLGRILLMPPIERQDDLRELIQCDILAIEDLQHLSRNADSDLTYLLDKRQQKGKLTLITANEGPGELGFGSRLSGRLVEGLVVRIAPLSEPSRRLLAAQLCRQRKLVVSPEVVAWLARSPGGARPILGEIASLQKLTPRPGKPLSLDQVMKHFAEEKEEVEKVSLEQIVKLVASRFQVDVKALRGPSRLKNIVWPRQVAMLLARETGRPLVEIGTYFGGRDHTTVMHACEKVERAAEDTVISEELRDLRARLR
jgi:chromosomal replication initiator protein